MLDFLRSNKELLGQSLEQLEGDAQKIFEYERKFKQGNDDALKNLGYMIPSQLKKYPCIAFTTSSKEIKWDLLSSQIEEKYILSFILEHKKEKIISVIRKSIDFLRLFEDQYQETKQKWATCIERFSNIPSNDYSNQQLMKEIILPILFFIRIQESQILALENSNMDRRDDNLNAIKRKLDRLEKYLEIKISFQTFKEKNNFIQYLENEFLNRKDILISISSNNLINGALFFDYSKTSYEKQREFNLIRFVSSDFDEFNAFDIELIVSLLFMMNIKYRIQLAQQPQDQKIFSAGELIDSFFFEAVLESVKYIRQNCPFLKYCYDQVKLGKQKILKQQDFQQMLENAVIHQIKSSKYFKEMRGVALDSMRNPQNFDAFITKELDDSFTVIFEEVYQELTVEKYSSLPELLMLKSAFNISRSKIILKSEENQLNKSSIQYLKYQLYPRSNRKSFQLIIEASFFCFFHFSCEDKNFKNFDKILLIVQNLIEEQDVLKIQEAIDGIKSLQGISNLTENQCSQVQRVAFIFVRHMYSWISSLFDRVDTKDEQPIIVKFLAKFEEIFQLKILVPPISANNKENYLDRYLSQNPDILLVFQDEACLIYKQIKMQTDNENMIMDNIASQTACNNNNAFLQSQIAQEQSQKEQQTPISAQGIQIQVVIPKDDLPEQLSFHSDLVYLIKNWSQVLSLFYLMNIKNVISYRNHREEEQYYQISTQRLIESPLFALILEKCNYQGAQDQSYNLEWNEQHYKQINNIMNEIWPRIAAGQNYKADNFAYSPQESFRANITNPNSRCPRYLVEFLPQNSINPTYLQQNFLCLQCKIRAAKVISKQMCPYCFTRQIQDSF